MHSFVGFGFRWIKPLTLPSISYFNLYSNFAVFSPHFACKFRSFAFALAQRQIGCEFFSISISIYAKSACTVELAAQLSYSWAALISPPLFRDVDYAELWLLIPSLRHYNFFSLPAISRDYFCISDSVPGKLFWPRLIVLDTWTLIGRKPCSSYL